MITATGGNGLGSMQETIVGGSGGYPTGGREGEQRNTRRIQRKQDETNVTRRNHCKYKA